MTARGRIGIWPTRIRVVSVRKPSAAARRATLLRAEQTLREPRLAAATRGKLAVCPDDGTHLKAVRSVVQFVHDGGRNLDGENVGRVRDTAQCAWSRVSYMVSFIRFGGRMGSRLRRVHSRLGGAAVVSNETGPL
jgi:hypothetical protein